MAYWLMKSEPDVFSIDRLRRENVAGWDGVRNYQARNNLRAMKIGDLALFYHSSVQPQAIVGVMKIVRQAYPDSTAKEGDWSAVDVEFVKAFPRPLTLPDIKKIAALQSMVLVNNTRLSVQPITPEEWKVLFNILDK
jgi:predicted RNA-binding protein with PUA-like domain